MNVHGNDDGVQGKLFHAIRAGDSTLVSELIKAGVDANVKDDEGRPAVVVAAEEGHDECLTVLISKVHDINQKDDVGNTALHAAACRGHYECLKSLIKSGLNLNRRNVKGETALCVATLNGYPNCVGELLGENADFDLSNENDKNTLCAAARKGHFDCLLELMSQQLYDRSNKYGSHIQEGLHVISFRDVVDSDSDICGIEGRDHGHSLDSSPISMERLHENIENRRRCELLCLTAILSQHECLQALMDIDAVDVNFQTNECELVPLCFAAQSGSLECLRVLINAGADVNLLSCRNNCKDALHHAVDYGQVECVRALVEAQADVNSEDIHGRTAVCVAAMRGDTRCLDILVAGGADLDKIGVYQSGKTPLFHALENGENESVKTLLRAGANVNAMDRNGQTPLAMAVKWNRYTAIKSLILAGANIHARDVNNKIALDESYHEKYFAEIKINEEKNPAILIAAWKGQSEEIANLIENGEDVNIKAEDGTTLLMAAAWEGHVQCVEILLSVDTIDINARDYCDRTALFAAACGGHIKCLKHILQQNGTPSDSDSRNSHGVTPLMIAIKKQKSECASALISVGADVTAADKAGDTAFNIAARYDNVYILKMLLETCAQFHHYQLARLCDDALVLAIANGNVECVEILFEYSPESRCSGENLLFRADKFGDIRNSMITLVKAGVFHWQWYSAFIDIINASMGETYDRHIRCITRELIINGFRPGQYESVPQPCTPLQHAFKIRDCGLVRYLLANLYVTPDDFTFFQRHTQLANFIHRQGSADIQLFHGQLVSSPWTLEVLSILKVFDMLTRYECKQEEATRRSEIRDLLPDTFVRRLTFLNPIRHLCVDQWDRIEVKFSNFKTPVWPGEEDMVPNSRLCHLCMNECMIINEDIL